MKRNSIHHRLFILLPVFLFLAVKLYSQDEKSSGEPLETTLSFVCTSTSDDSIQLRTLITVKHEEGANNLANAAVKFSVTGTDGDFELGIVKTDLHGVAILKVPAKNSFPRNESSLINFKAVFEGTGKYSGSEGEFALKPSKFTVSFYEEDSVKYVKVEGLQYNDDGSTSPFGPADIILTVPKMFSMLKIAELSLDSTGMGSVEFPAGIIGDSLGNLKVTASLEEHEVFGNVTGFSLIKWGIPKHLLSPDRPSRELWTPIAPLWMIITLIIMLAGVWGHYIYAVIQLVMIRKLSPATEPEPDKNPGETEEK